MTEFESKQQASYANLANACFQVIPDCWDLLTLNVEKKEEGTAHSISGPKGDSQVVIPNDGLYEATLALEDLFAEYSKSWDSFTFKLKWNEENENWSYHADFKYA